VGATEPALALVPATACAEIVEADADPARSVELLLCESLLCTDGPGDCIGWPIALRNSLRTGRGGGVLVSSGCGVVVDRADAFCCCRRVLEGRRTREGRRVMKLLMTSETENAGMSGELRFLGRARGDFEVCCDPSKEGRVGGDDEMLFARERERGLEVCAKADAEGGGGDPQNMEENDERDECERKKCVDVGSEDCGDDDEMLGRFGGEFALGPCGVVGISEGVPHVVDRGPSG